ncbi:uncharacterized protein CELE_ZK177.9 [Caenorhabditis elegans]|uniref:Uncharacterized protein ZK177.9 n=1 Tax=Caenorhabditis elegans TaxID=6239 RepID=YS49_CAEEL|nr:Uncharacterized protein CELE_ZK177.9 [Caenorhabditis elegans]Q09375.1 RecName: Full=Uncharacterized protein ZK177.9 [Caenorhabditis elegans]CCD64862.1 Uncharacterized protein CELE_ZK177.9 [Caenorhabditis elegans]|eukprot:NP_495057.1 Uncharacterized protein CELE_ZK177.9 [Caenorhabditis elegans]
MNLKEIPVHDHFRETVAYDFCAPHHTYYFDKIFNQYKSAYQKPEKVDEGVQTTLRGDIKLEPFEKAVDRFRKQLSVARKLREENPDAESVDEEKERLELFQCVKVILGEDIWMEYVIQSGK